MRTPARSIVQGLLVAALAAAFGQGSAQELNGKSLYMKNCSACHQADGQGIPDAFPALAGNAFVQGEASAVAAVPLSGRNAMPNFSKRIADAELAAILSYVRSAWGNHAPPIDTAEIASLRKSLHADDFDPTPDNNRH